MPFVLLGAAVLAQTSAPPLRVSMIAVGVTDAARSIRFYGEVLGLEMAGKPGEVTFFKAGPIMIALNGPLGHSASSIAGAVEIIFPVENVAEAYSRLLERGCNFIAKPHEVTPGLWAATFTDPDSHKLTVLGPR